MAVKELKIRLPDDLAGRVQRSADADKRTINRQVEWLLERGLQARSNIGRSRKVPTTEETPNQ